MLKLKESVDFAKTVGQLKRTKEARELWASVYHDLSKEKPGLFGAMIARGAPQVLRTSEHYALLDCSKEVCVEHLQAALECWRYCEDSARWTFQAGTGNKNADRILAALAAAEEKGMTRWQITNEVFNRNATKFEIDAALRLLHGLKLAVRNIEGTETRPAERWFFNRKRYEEYEVSPLGAKVGYEESIRGVEVDSSYSSYGSQPKDADQNGGDSSYSSLTLQFKKEGSPDPAGAPKTGEEPPLEEVDL